MTNTTPNGEDQSVLSRRLVRYGLIWGIWTVVALFFTTQVYVSYYAENQPIRYLQGFLFQSSICYIWALVTPLILWLARRFRIAAAKSAYTALEEQSELARIHHGVHYNILKTH